MARTLPRLTPEGAASYDRALHRGGECHGHQGARAPPSRHPRRRDAEDADKTMKFYADVLGLSHDPGRPSIPTIPGYWMDVGGRAQIHLMGVNGQSKFAQGPGKDPSLPHVALAVPDIQEARKELDRLGASYWVSEGVVGPRSQQIFLHDPAGDMTRAPRARRRPGQGTRPPRR